jgi:glycosyltransferase involved in cell wall biosynthesis
MASLVNQTLKEIEIIVVLDCPTDGSDRIAEQYAAADARVKTVYNTENLHTGLSRNRGLEMACGEYIGFHDDDDYSEPAMYETLYRKAKTEGRDVVRCNFSCVYTGSKDADREEKYVYPETGEGEEWKKRLYGYVCGNKISCVLWNHIYQASFLEKYRIRFEDSRSVCSEDSLFFLETYSKLNEPAGVTPAYLYCHAFHSSNTGRNYQYRAVGKRIVFFEKLHDFLTGNGIDENCALGFLSENVVCQMYSASRQAFLLFPLKKAIAEIRQIGKNRLMMDCIRYLHKNGQLRVLFRQKPTVIAFTFIMRLLPTHLYWRK